MQRSHLQDLAEARLRQSLREASAYAAIVNPTGPARRAVPGVHPDEADFSFREFFSQLTGQGGLVRGLEREVCEEGARQSGVPFDFNKPVVPWGCFTRASPDEKVGTASAGGFLVETDVLGVVDILRPFSVAVGLGVTVLSGLQGNATIPAVKSTTTARWLSDEASSAAASAVTLGQIGLTPKTVADTTSASRQLLLQSSADVMIRNELLKTVATAIDAAILNGPGVSGQPLGILGTAGIQTVSGASLAWAGLLSMHSKVAAADANDAAVAWLSTPAVREVLSAREKAAGDRFLWEDDKIDNRRAFVSTTCPTATLLAADWSDIVLATWGAGPEIALNPFDPTGFQVGTFQFRLMLSVDVACRHPSAICVATSVS